MDDAINLISAGIRAQLLEQAVKVLGPQNRHIAEAVTDRIGPGIDSLLAASASLDFADLRDASPEVIAERVKQYAERVFEAAASTVIVGTFVALGAGLAVGVRSRKPAAKSDRRFN